MAGPYYYRPIPSESGAGIAEFGAGLAGGIEGGIRNYQAEKDRKRNEALQAIEFRSQLSGMGGREDLPPEDVPGTTPPPVAGRTVPLPGAQPPTDAGQPPPIFRGALPGAERYPAGGGYGASGAPAQLDFGAGTPAFRGAVTAPPPRTPPTAQLPLPGAAPTAQPSSQYPSSQLSRGDYEELGTDPYTGHTVYAPTQAGRARQQLALALNQKRLESQLADDEDERHAQDLMRDNPKMSHSLALQTVKKLPTVRDYGAEEQARIAGELEVARVRGAASHDAATIRADAERIAAEIAASSRASTAQTGAASREAVGQMRAGATVESAEDRETLVNHIIDWMTGRKKGAAADIAAGGATPHTQEFSDDEVRAAYGAGARTDEEIRAEILKQRQGGE